MMTNPRTAERNVGPRPLGKLNVNSAHGERIVEDGTAVCRRTDGKENGAETSKSVLSRGATPSKSVWRKPASIVNTTTPSKSAHRRAHKNIKECEKSTPLIEPSWNGISAGRRREERQSVTARAHCTRESDDIIRAGSVRVKTPLKSVATRTAKVGKRIGIDGTSRTPSKELLRSTACSRGHQVVQSRQIAGELRVPFNDGASAESTTHILTSGESPAVDQGPEMSEESSDSTIATHSKNGVGESASLPDLNRRGFLENPVALTLLNDGKENWEYLMKMDRSPSASDLDSRLLFRLSPPKRLRDAPSLESPAQDVLKVSSNLRDVKNEEEVSSLVRPIAMAAKGQVLSFEA